MGYLRSQPLVHMAYFPEKHLLDLPSMQTGATKPGKRTAEDERRFRHLAIFYHEMVHSVVLDRLPAKELARFHLAKAYDFIGMLLETSHQSKDSFIETAWARFQESNDAIDTIGQRVTFVEELLATGFMILMMHYLLEPGHGWDDFADVVNDLQRKALLRHEERFPGFIELISKAIPLIALMMNHADLFAFMLPILEPLRFESEVVEAVYGHLHLGDIVNFLDGVDDPAEIRTRLEPLRHEIDMAWSFAMVQQEESLFNPSVEPGSHKFNLRTVTQLLRTVSDNVDYASSLIGGDSPRAALTSSPLELAIVSPIRIGGQMMLDVASCEFGPTRTEPAYSENLDDLVFLESLRQQLCAGKSIFCPRNLTGSRTCQCSPEIRRGVHTIARLALNEKAFGEGDWLLPSCYRL
jgi:hypothetical protein